MLLGFTAGCGQEGDERAFAPPAGATRQADGTPGLPLVAASPPPAEEAEPTLTAAQLVKPRGAPERFYFLNGSSLWTMAGDGEAAPVIGGDGAAVTAFSASPSGDRVATLVAQPPAGGAARVDLVVLAADGKEQRRIENIGAALTRGENQAPSSLDWSPQGDRLLVAFADGALYGIDAGGTAPPTLLGRVAGATPTAARWSPTGEQVAILTGGEEGGRLLLLPVAATPEAAQPLPASSDERSVSAVSWSPDGRALLVVERADGVGSAAGDLWQIAVADGRRRLVATAGVAAPVAQVVTIWPSPNGAAVAYTIEALEGDALRFHSLRVEELASGRPLEISVPLGSAVTDVWWTSAGLVFRAVPRDDYGAAYDGGPFELFRVDPGLEPELIFTADAPAATPEPAASPSDAATPAGDSGGA